MTPAPSQQTALIDLLDTVESRVGLRFPENRYEMARSVIEKAALRAGREDLNQYRAFLDNSPAEFDRLVGELTIGETYFFRHPEQFQTLKDHVLPDLLKRRPFEKIAIWSAGCASGEEPYSLAILVKEMGLESQTEILGTDISKEALRRAQEGVYRKWSLRSRFQDWTDRYLKWNGSAYSLDEDIKRLVKWEFQNLVGCEGSARRGPHWDLIVCRNVLIYFDQPTVARVARSFFDQLRPGGWLMLGASDPPIWDLAAFETINFPSGVIYQKPVKSVKPAPASNFAPHQESPKPREEIPERPVPFEPQPPMTDEEPDFPIALKRAQRALDAGQYHEAAALVADWPEHPAACELQIRALANIDPNLAVAKCGEFTESHPTHAGIHYLHSVLLMDHNELEAASTAARRALYLDRSLVIVHQHLGMLHDKMGNRDLAVRAWSTARSLCDRHDPATSVPLNSNETMGHLKELVDAQLARLGVKAQ